MLKTKQILNGVFDPIFTAGEIFEARPADNLNDYRRKERVYAYKPNGSSILLQQGDYELIEGKLEEHYPEEFKQQSITYYALRTK